MLIYTIYNTHFKPFQNAELLQTFSSRSVIFLNTVLLNTVLHKEILIIVSLLSPRPFVIIFHQLLDMKQFLSKFLTMVFLSLVFRRLEKK